MKSRVFLFSVSLLVTWFSILENLTVRIPISSRYFSMNRRSGTSHRAYLNFVSEGSRVTSHCPTLCHYVENRSRCFCIIYTAYQSRYVEYKKSFMRHSFRSDPRCPNSREEHWICKWNCRSAFTLRGKNYVEFRTVETSEKNATLEILVRLDQKKATLNRLRKLFTVQFE